MKSRTSKPLDERQRSKAAQHLPYAVGLTKTFLRGWKSLFQDAEGIAGLSLVLAMGTYDSSRGRDIRSHIWRLVRWSCLDAIQNEMRHRERYPQDAEPDEPWETHVEFEEVCLRDTVRYVGVSWTPDMRRLMEGMIFQGLNQKEAGAFMGRADSVVCRLCAEARSIFIRRVAC